MKSVVFAVLIILSACGSKDFAVISAEEKSAVIYTEDSRSEVDSDDGIAVLAQATAILINSSTTYFSTLGDSYPLCRDERFQEQMLIGYCSGVLVAPNKVLTAAHCVDLKNSCELTNFAFGRTLNNQKTELYRCQQILSLDSRLDYAVVELDRDVNNATPVKLSTRTDVSVGETVLSLSYPLGMPLKKDFGTVKALQTWSSSNFFKVKVDTFSGSSGSPLFDSRGELIGILSRGEEDFLEDEIYRVRTRGGCVNFKRCAGNDCRGESFLKIPLISDKF